MMKKRSAHPKKEEIILSERYRLLELIYFVKNKRAGNRYSELYKAKELATGEFFAIKCYKRQNNEAWDTKSKELLVHEATVLKALSHPGVVGCDHYAEGTVVSGDTQVDWYYIVLKYVEGVTLLQFAPHCSEEQMLVHIMRECFQVMTYVNRMKLAHLDLKDSNIMVDKEGHVRFIDFGSALPVCGLKGDGRLDAWVGTPGFKAPEAKEHDVVRNAFAVDAFSLGCILFCLAFKFRPFDTETGEEMLAKGFTAFWAAVDTRLAGIRLQREREGKPKIPEIDSVPLRELISALMWPEPCCRPSMGEALFSPWMQQAKAKEIECREAMAKIKAIVARLVGS